MASLLDNLERVSVDAVSPHPDNARKGNVTVIKESLAANKQFAPLIVQRSTGYVLAGNHTLLAAQKLGWPEVDVAYVDVDDDRARKIMLAANRTADSATYDSQALLDLLESLDGDYEGTGYTPDDLDDLLSALDQVAQIPNVGTSAAYAETEEEFEARQERVASWEPQKGRGIRETVIILPQDDHDELHVTFARLRASMREEDLTNGQIVLRAVRAFDASTRGA